jgi:starch synthase
MEEKSAHTVNEPLRILFVTAEVTPFARTGGLGDVNGALPPVLAAQGHDVRVAMPLYQSVREREVALTRVLADLDVPLIVANRRTQVWQSVLDGQNGRHEYVPVYFIEQDDYFARPALYGNERGDYPDNAQRFLFFCRAVLALAERLSWFPHVVHCHDWHTGLVPAFLRSLPGLAPQWSSAASLFTIHNLAYQGVFPAWVFGITGLPLSLFQPHGVEFFGALNFMKAGLVYADRLTTVSPSYAEEICTSAWGFGLDGVLRARRDGLTGILNGVDEETWNPASDTHIIARYSPDDLSGKAACKAALLRTYALPDDLDVPLIGMISRLVDQKGVDLFAAALEQLLSLNVRIVILGSGEPRYEEMLTAAAQAQPQRVGIRIGFDDALAHQIEAGCDCFLMPSRYEPCGLNQMYSMRYGTVPIVRATGGLRDTVTPFNPSTGQGTGFLFQEASPEALLVAVRAAVEVFVNKQAWRQLMRNGMAQDFSWRRSAGSYLDLYQQLITQRTTT